MKLKTKEMTMVALMAAATAVVAVVFRFYPLVLGTVPFSILPFMVVLAGGILGARLGALSMLVYLAMGLVGFQVFATEPYGGPLYVLKPTFGFVLGYIPAAYVSGILSHKRKRAAGLFDYALAMTAGMVVIYLVGIPYTYLMMNFYLGTAVALWKIISGMLVFIILDLIKGLFAAVISFAVVKRLGSGYVSGVNNKEM